MQFDSLDENEKERKKERQKQKRVKEKEMERQARKKEIEREYKLRERTGTCRALNLPFFLSTGFMPIYIHVPFFFFFWQNQYLTLTFSTFPKLPFK